MLLFRLKNINISCFCLLLTLMFVVGGGDVVKGQYIKTYSQYVGPAPANTGGTNGTGGAGGLGAAGAAGSFSITNHSLINDTDYTNYAEIKAISGQGGGLLGGTGTPSTAYMQISFTGANTPKTGTPIIIKLNSTIPDKVQIQAYNGASPVGSAQTITGLSLTSLGEYVFTPTGNCTSIRINIASDIGLTLGGISTNTTNLFYAYIFEPTCDPPNYTNTSISTILDLGSGFTNVPDAIDGNLNTFSKLAAGLGVGTTLRQHIFFSKLSGPQDAATITLSVPTSALAVGVASNIIIRAYNGSTQVNEISFGGLLLGTDLLNLLNSGAPATISFAPGAAFNRVDISLTSLIALATSLNIYEVQTTPGEPTFASPATQNITICAGSPAVLTAIAPDAGNELRWYTTVVGGSPVFTGTSFTPSPALTTTTTYYVATAKTGCIAESERVPAKVTVTPLPVVSEITGSAPVCIGQSVSLLNVTAGGVWESSDPLKATVTSGGVVTGVAAGTVTINYKVTVNGCTGIASTPVTINLQPSLPAISARSICLGQTVNLSALNPADSNGSTGGSYVWSATVGGTALSSTTVTPSLGNTTYYLRYTKNGCFSDSNVLVVVHPKPPTPHVTLNLN